MSNDSRSSLLSRLWDGALVLCGIAVLGWIAAQLIMQVWVVLVIVAAAAIVVSAAVVAMRWWLRSRRW